MESSITTPFEPLIKLTQSNMALLTEFWLSPEVMWQPLMGSQRSFTPNQGATTATGVSEAWSRLVKGVMENYSRFYVELAQSGMNAWNRRPAASATVSAAGS